MRYGLPGVTSDRWALYLLEQRRAAGEDVTFTPEQIAVLQAEAEHANEVLDIDELRSIYGPQEPDPDAEAA